MSAALARMKEKISPKAFMQGLIVVGLLYAALFGFLAYKGENTRNALQQKLASETIAIAQDEHVITEPAEPAHAEPAPEAPSHPTEETVHAPAHEEEHHPETTLSGDLYENTPGGSLPKIAASGATVFSAYKHPYVYQEKPVIALVLTGYGVSGTDSELALAKLPAEISLVLSPYSENPDEWKAKARAQEREIWIQMPLENKSFPLDDPGPKALMTSNSLKTNQDNLNWMLSRTKEYAGVATHMDEIFLGSRPFLENIVKSLYKRGVGYLELNPMGPDLVENLALTNGGFYVRTATMLPAALPESLLAAENDALKNGSTTLAVALTPLNVKMLEGWIATLGNKGLAIAPISALAAAKEPTPVPEAPAHGHD
ncbi:MAG: divergent polysaccharide deacetylase family protein [Alphaproteobacteria bacterium]|nr:divergent polysaccharide deacetylase family protein [Alphaproteobacteria bacterium]